MRVKPGDGRDEDKNSLTSSLVDRRQRWRTCSHENFAYGSLSRRSTAPPLTLQPLAARRHRDAHRSVLRARGAGLPRQNARRHDWGSQVERKGIPGEQIAYDARGHAVELDEGQRSLVTVDRINVD